jgi:Ca2+-binding RTX toxin-like protein
VTGFDGSDVAVENGTLSNLVSSDGGATWSAVFTPTANIEDLTNVLKVTGRYTDLAGNVGGGSTSDNYAIDTKNPTVDISQTKANVGRTVAVTFTFSEAVGALSFTAQDIAVTGAKLHGLVSNGGASYSAILTPHFSSSGKISVAVKDASYADVNGNAGTGASETFAITSTKGTGSADWIVGTNGKNTLRGGNGDDVVRGGKGNDTIMGDGGRDLLDLSDGRKGVAITLSQHDTRYGTFDGRSAGLGIDKYRDMEGVIGTQYSDKLSGSASSDILAGLGGSDVLRGSRGNDVFVFEAKGGRDRIMDFEDIGRRQDTLDVSFFDFDVNSANFAAWKASHMNQVGRDTIVTLDSDTSIRLVDIKVKAIGFDDFLF